MRSHTIAAGLVSAILAFSPAFSALALADGAGSTIAPVAAPSPSPSPMASPTSSATPAPTQEPATAPPTEPSATPTPRPMHNNGLTYAVIAVAVVVAVIFLQRYNKNVASLPFQSVQRKPGLSLQFHFR